jgi:hypothetical protein
MISDTGRTLCRCRLPAPLGFGKCPVWERYRPAGRLSPLAFWVPSHAALADRAIASPFAAHKHVFAMIFLRSGQRLPCVTQALVNQRRQIAGRSRPIRRRCLMSSSFANSLRINYVSGFAGLVIQLRFVNHVLEQLDSLTVVVGVLRRQPLNHGDVERGVNCLSNP